MLFPHSLCLCPCITSQVKIPKQGSITFVGSGDAGSAKEPKFLDLTHLGPKHKTGINVKLPEVETQGESLARDTRELQGHGLRFTGQASATGGHMQLSWDGQWQRGSRI